MKNYLIACLKSWKTTLLAVVPIVKAGLMASQSTDIMATLHDSHFQMFVVVGVLGLIARDAGNSADEKKGEL